jgi:hypothetical protein
MYTDCLPPSEKSLVPHINPVFSAEMPALIYRQTQTFRPKCVGARDIKFDRLSLVTGKHSYEKDRWGYQSELAVLISSFSGMEL